MNIPVPVGEEVGPKVVRLLYFVGAGFLCTAAINKWRDLEKKANIQKQQKELLENSSAKPNAVQNAME
ncbi:hypothetical protein ACH5RR_028178 [Cinchona calisaya]|uniref:Transmembrane protein n=1 Tax=Cinchona calisaya TaxID=153742 RepID=A0ABD2YRB4_9GENT